MRKTKARAPTERKLGALLFDEKNLTTFFSVAQGPPKRPSNPRASPTSG